MAMPPTPSAAAERGDAAPLVEYTVECVAARSTSPLPFGGIAINLRNLGTRIFFKFNFSNFKFDLK